ncbi:MAG: hydrolase [Candidatus Anoxymicrobium japonicum]|uniref:Hydrolase n=1 Tax=Candidatus Anoxymicrobium japonicum TaxID=2013648 RepID=A0A2N3G6B8_9ACTN|nr:MAG: hydrolase [Candidatus Anoxymicrobium japonicum]
MKMTNEFFREECVLVIIDMQEKLLAVMDEKEKVLSNALKLARFAKIVGVPVLVTEQEKLGPTVSELANEINGFDPISKLDFDAYQVPRFAETLMELGRWTVVLAGIESHICVTQTALSLLRFFNVHIVADAVSSRTAENRTIALERMGFEGATITSTEMFIYEALKRAGTDEFKETLKLIR